MANLCLSPTKPRLKIKDYRHRRFAEAKRLKKITHTYRDADMHILAVEPQIKPLHNTPADAINGAFLFEGAGKRPS
jgi:hypothetical protein